MLRSDGKTSLLFSIYVCYVAFFGLAPFTFHSEDAVALDEQLQRRFEGMSSVWRATVWDLSTNLLLFFPFGSLFMVLPFARQVRPSVRLLVSALCAGLFSLVIELAQTFLPRDPSLVDIGCNVLGAVLGGASAMAVFSRAKELNWGTPWGVLPPSWVTGVGYWVILGLLLAVPLPLIPDFSNWDPELRLHVGSERLLSEPWRGDVYGIRIYDRALSRDEVRAHFSPGPPSATRPPAAWGPLIEYVFSEGSGTVAHDSAALNDPVDLFIEDSSLVRWLVPHGLSIHGSALVSSSGSERAWLERLSRSNEMTLESWVAPADVKQRGPLPFVSFSDNTDLRNFTLAQDGRDLVFWLRTPMTGLNGRQRELRTADHPLTENLQHIVVTYAERTAVLYLDGLKRGHVLLDTRYALFDRLVDSIGPYYEVGVRSLVMFPFGFLSYLALGRLVPRWISTMATVVGVSALEAVRMFLLMQPVDPTLIVISAGTVLLASLAARELFTPDSDRISIPV